MRLSKRPVALIILDGWGLAEDSPGNAVSRARTPTMDRLAGRWPSTQLEASGRQVGLPDGQMGNSEVGHMNLGAGRVVMQSLTYLDSQIESGAFFDNPVLIELMKRPALHLMGLLGSGGVHSQLEHLLALVEMANRQVVPEVFVHAFTDGRDTPPDSACGFLAELEPRARIATVCGRYYAMDRDQRWERVEKAYRAVVQGQAPHRARSALEAVEQAYRRGETDEFILPTIVADPRPIRDGEAVFFFNFRTDRARQLGEALLAGPDWPHFARNPPGIELATMMEVEQLGAPFAFALPELSRGLAEVVSEAGLTQFHAAETEKYPHVTSFFNLQREEPYSGEVRLLVPSPRVATYDLQPEMSALELTERTLQRLATGTDDLLVINYANPDMVGHTGVLSAAVEACEAVDACLGRLLEAIQELGGVALVVADHGNAEVMLDEQGEPHTAHTTNPVPCLGVGIEGQLAAGGCLADVAPTLLELLGLSQPPEMTGRSLLHPPS